MQIDEDPETPSKTEQTKPARAPRHPNAEHLLDQVGAREPRAKSFPLPVSARKFFLARSHDRSLAYRLWRWGCYDGAEERRPRLPSWKSWKYSLYLALRR